MLRFAVAGTPHSTPKPGGTVEGLKRARALGIAAMEMEWVQQVPKNPERIAEIRQTAEELDMYLTVHAPYYINLNSSEKATLVASKRRILDAMEMGQLAGAHSVCVHPAFYMGTDPARAFENVCAATEDILAQAKKKNLTINLAYETMGKGTQFGTLDEVLRLSAMFGIYPCVDPAHMHARSNGEWNTAKEWNTMLDLYEEHLGKSALKTMHMHYSGIEYTAKGERRHLPLAESDARWRDFLTVLKQRKVGGVVVCESPLLEDDTLVLQRTFEKL
jgi:deoxyribonuclease-4